MRGEGQKMDKEIESGERIYPKSFSEALLDHQERYRLALQFIKEKNDVLDVACGVGFGSQFMAMNSDCRSVVAIDKSDHALQWAKSFFPSNKVRYIKADLEKEFVKELPILQYDVITCFETVEHLKEDRVFLTKLCHLLSPNGIIIISAPNEDVIPHENNPFFPNRKNPFHYRHYRVNELEQLVTDCGFYIIDRYTQDHLRLVKGQGKEVNILIANKG